MTFKMFNYFYFFCKCVETDEQAVPAPYVAPVMLVLLQTRGVFNDNELNMCDECHKKKNIYVIIKLQMISDKMFN
jgi:hypothetical protein